MSIMKCFLIISSKKKSLSILTTMSTMPTKFNKFLRGFPQYSVMGKCTLSHHFTLNKQIYIYMSILITQTSKAYNENNWN
jgi:hypothetical protein